MAGIEAVRKLEKDGIAKQAVAMKGDFAQMALQTKLVNGIKTRDEVRELLKSYGAPDKMGHSVSQEVALKEYLSRIKAELLG